MEFVNIVATFDTAAPIKVVLAAHHDSKWFDGREVSARVSGERERSRQRVGMFEERGATREASSSREARPSFECVVGGARARGRSRLPCSEERSEQGGRGEVIQALGKAGGRRRINPCSQRSVLKLSHNATSREVPQSQRDSLQSLPSPVLTPPQFLGATDSAAPCAMLLDLAQALTPALRARKTRLANASDDEDEFDEREAAQTTLQIVFFDGEEAFHDWTATDSIYGSRYVPPPHTDTSTSPCFRQAPREPLGIHLSPPEPPVPLLRPHQTPNGPNPNRAIDDRTPRPARPPRLARADDHAVVPRNRVAIQRDEARGREVAREWGREACQWRGVV